MKPADIPKRPHGRMIALVFALLFGVTFPAAAAEPPQANWIAGPAGVDLGGDLAELNLEDGYIFADGKDAAAILEYMGNVSHGTELGLIAPNDEANNWFIVFEHFPIGYVKDDDKDDIDSAAILKSIRQGTEKSNKIRAERGVSPLHIKGWHREPFYDESTHNLTWTILAEQDGEELVNHNVRLLGRKGYISVVLVADVPTLEASTVELDRIISNVSYKKGQSYAEFVKGDKVAQYGLTALIAGGSAAAAVKFGLFKFLGKAWKLIALGVVGLLAALRKTFKSVFGGKKHPAEA
jgi:uncharacterized membrane-anchored protein